MTRAERKQQGPGMGEGRFQRSNHRRLLEAWPHLGPGPSTRRAAQSLLPRRVPGSGAPHNPSQGCEVRTAHSAGGLCPAFFRIFVVVVVVGGSVGWGAGPSGRRPRVRRETGVSPRGGCPARAAARGGAAVSGSRPRAGAVPPRRRAPRPRGPRSAPEPWGAARGPGCGRSPGDVVSGPRASARPRAWLREPGAPERGKTPPARRELPSPRLPLQDSPGFWSTWEGN